MPRALRRFLFAVAVSLLVLGALLAYWIALHPAR